MADQYRDQQNQNNQRREEDHRHYRFRNMNDDLGKYSNEGNPPDRNNLNSTYYSQYNDKRYRGADNVSKGMGNDFIRGNFGSNTRSDGYWEDTRQVAGSSIGSRGTQSLWQGNQGNRGKGPRGYQRSGDRIREDVCERLSDDSYIDASNMEVSVENNEVILRGTVHSREEKRRAEDLAESISGVKNVQNQLRVESGQTNNNAERSNT